MQTSVLIRLVVVLLFVFVSGVLPAAGITVPTETKNAVILAHFGTTVPSALPAITNISDAVRKAYPETEVRLTFTSNMIRKTWKKRQNEAQKWLDQGIPAEILYVKNVIATIGDLLEDGYTNIIVQPSHMFYMEQSYDLQQHIVALASIQTIKDRWKPFDNLVMGRPALGMPGIKYPYHEDISAVAETLSGDVELARNQGAILVYMGHGNEHWSTGVYAETQKKMRELYPDVQTFIGVVEGTPALEELLPQMKATGHNKIILKPFMIVAGDHATNDMAGSEESSWKSILVREGFEVDAVLEGLGSNQAFARLFIDHIADAAKEKGIELR